MSNFKNKSCSELLLTNGMGLDGAPIKIFTLVFLRRPTAQYITVSMGSIYTYKKKFQGGIVIILLAGSPVVGYPV